MKYYIETIYLRRATKTKSVARRSFRDDKKKGLNIAFV